MNDISNWILNSPRLTSREEISERVVALETTNAELLEALNRIIKADHSLGHGLTCEFCIDKANAAIARATRLEEAEKYG